MNPCELCHETDNDSGGLNQVTNFNIILKFLPTNLFLIIFWNHQNSKKEKVSEELGVEVELETIEKTSPTIVTQENFPQAFTNMRLAAIVKKTGGVNTFFKMPVPSSIPEEQFVVRMNRDTPYSVSVIDMSSKNVFIILT